jgi:hypothetical protein
MREHNITPKYSSCGTGTLKSNMSELKIQTLNEDLRNTMQKTIIDSNELGNHSTYKRNANNAAFRIALLSLSERFCVIPDHWAVLIQLSCMEGGILWN